MAVVSLAWNPTLTPRGDCLKSVRLNFDSAGDVSLFGGQY